MDTKHDSGGRNDSGVHPGRQMAFAMGFFLTSLVMGWLFQELVASRVVSQAGEIPYSEFRV